MGGFIKLFRDLEKSWLWNVKPFSYGQAWVDMLLAARYEDTEECIDGKIIIVNRGSFRTSILKLSDRYGWERKKTTAFLEKLEKKKMIETIRTTHGTTITIVNYGKFQDSGTTKGQPLGQPIGQTIGQAIGQPQPLENSGFVYFEGQPLGQPLGQALGQPLGHINKEYKENNTDNEKSLSQNVFIPPTLEEVKAYCETRNYSINAQDFIDYYAGKNWMVDNAKMKNWKRAVITWETRSKNGKPGKSKKSIENIEQLKADFTIIFKLYPKEEGFTDSFKLYIEWVTVGRIVNGINYKLTNRQIYKAVQKYIRFKEREDIDIKYWVSFKKIMDDMLIDYVDFEE